MRMVKNTTDAKRVVITSGKYKGQTLGDVAAHDILYLHDWIKWYVTHDTRLKQAVSLICDERARELDKLIKEREERHVR